MDTVRVRLESAVCSVGSLSAIVCEHAQKAGPKAINLGSVDLEFSLLRPELSRPVPGQSPEQLFSTKSALYEKISYCGGELRELAGEVDDFSRKQPAAQNAV
jgi:hypothetical protein